MKQFQSLMMTAALLMSAQVASAMSPSTPSLLALLGVDQSRLVCCQEVVGSGPSCFGSSCPLANCWIADWYQATVNGWKGYHTTASQTKLMCQEDPVCCKSACKTVSTCCAKSGDVCEAQKCCCAKACACCEACKATRKESAAQPGWAFPLRVGVDVNFRIQWKHVDQAALEMLPHPMPMVGLPPLPPPAPPWVSPGPRPAWGPMAGPVGMPMPSCPAVQEWIVRDRVPGVSVSRPSVVAVTPPAPPAGPYQLVVRPTPVGEVHRAQRAHLVSADLEAHCERMTHKGDVVVLEGDVRLVCKKNGQQIRVEAHRVVLNAKDGTFTVESAGRVTHAPPMTPVHGHPGIHVMPIPAHGMPIEIQLPYMPREDRRFEVPLPPPIR